MSISLCASHGGIEEALVELLDHDAASGGDHDAASGGWAAIP